MLDSWSKKSDSWEKFQVNGTPSSQERASRISTVIAQASANQGRTGS
jgi:hypothetical protein